MSEYARHPITEKCFWQHYEEYKTKPIDVMVRIAEPQQALEFVNACSELVGIADSINPDVIVIPLRGAAPISWTMEEIERIRGNVYDRLYVPIGTHIDINTYQKEGYAKELKHRVLKIEAQRLLDRRNGDPIQRPLLIDEVKGGASITTTAHGLVAAFNELHGCSDLEVLALEDTFTERKPKNRYAKGYKAIKEGEFPNLHMQIISMPLFTIDAAQFLDYILEPTNAPIPTRHQMLHVVQNIESQKFFRNLAQSTMYPADFQRALDIIVGRCLITDNESERVQGFYKWLQGMCSGDKKYMGSANSVKIISWFSEFVMQAKG